MAEESAKPTSLPNLDGMSEQQRLIIAEGIASMDRFSAKPVLKDGKPFYKGNTVGTMAHLKAKRGA